MEGHRPAFCRLGDLPYERSSVDPDRIYASQTSAWFGQIIQRSDDDGKTWNPPGTKPEDLMTSDGMPKGESNMFAYDASPETGKPLTTHQWYDGTQHPWEFKRVWHLEPSLHDPDHVYAGVEDAALFQSKDGGKSWQELAGCVATIPVRNGSQARAGCVCTPFFSIQTIPIEFPLQSRLPARFAPTMAERRGSRSIAGCTRSTSRIPTRKSVTACIGSRCIRRAQTRCSCKSIGT